MKTNIFQTHLRGDNSVSIYRGGILLLMLFGLLFATGASAQTPSCPVGGVTWTAQAAAQANSWKSITYGNGIFVAVASDGTNRVMTSPDGITWTARTAAEANEWNAVTFANGVFVAVASSGTNRVMTSSNGITWTAREADGANSWRSVAYGNGYFVAVASDGTNRVMLSDDGRFWFALSAAEANSWRSITFGNGVFVAVASDGTNRVMTSTNGFGWTAVAAAEANAWQSVAYGTVGGTGTFVAVASDGTNQVMTSTDGSTWTPQAVAASAWSSVAYGNGKFVATAATGATHRVMNSTDAINWTTRTPAEANQWESVAYGNNYFVAVSSNGTNRVMTSLDVIAAAVKITSSAGFRINLGSSVTFTATPTNGGSAPRYVWKKNNVTIANEADPTYTTTSLVNGDVIQVEMNSSDACALPATATSNSISIEVAEACPNDGILWQEGDIKGSNNWTSVTYGNGLYVAVSEDGTDRVMTSPDGITWTTRPAVENNSWKSVTYANGLFVAVSSYGNVMTSPDGINWTARTAASSENWISVTYGNGLFVTVAEYSSSVMTSPDGINWTTQTVPFGSWRSVTYGNGLFVAVSAESNNNIMTSPDGINWTARPSGIRRSWKSVAYGNGLFVAVAEGGYTQVMTSPDGITWTARIGGAIGRWSAVTYGNGLFVVAGNPIEARVIISRDGIDWTAQASPGLFSITSVAYGNGRFVVVAGNNYGDRGQAMTSTNIAASVSIASNEPDNSFVPGTSVTFTATPTNGGSTPVYQWKKNNVNVGTNSNTYTDNALANGDAITVEMLSNEPCVAVKTVQSNPVAVEVIVPDCTPSGINWTSRVVNDADWRSVTYGNGLYVAVAYDDGRDRSQVMTSPDGINWTSRVNSEDIQWYSVTYGNGLFVAVGQAGITEDGARIAIMTSPDGIKWTTRLTPNNSFLTDITYANGMFVIVGFNMGGANQNIVTSTDGINWTARTSATTASWDAITYGKGLFVAVAGYEDSPVMTSPDGINWTAQTFDARSDWHSVTYGNGRFVAVAAGGPQRTMTSTDGINWTVQTGGIESAWRAVTYGDNKFIAVASSGDTRVMTSPDGLTWTPQVAAENNEWRGITFANGLFVAVAESGNSRVMTSRAPVFVTPSVSVAANPSGSVSEGTSITFTATPTNGGTAPTYVWKKNDTVIPNEAGATYTTTTLVNGDKIKVEMTSNDACANPALAISNEITLVLTDPCQDVTNRIYVTPNGTGNGSSWANATSDLQAAINNTCGVTEIWVKAGTYIPQKDPFGNANPTDPRDKAFMLRDGIAIYGGFAGTETERSQRNPATNVTILSGDIGTPNDPSDDCYHVGISILDGASTVLDGFTITKGTTSSGFNQLISVEGYLVYKSTGGGLNIQESEITVNNCVFDANSGDFGGGVYVYMDAVAPVISNCRFINNRPVGTNATGLGLNLEAYGDAEISINNCDFSSNTGAKEGGAVYFFLLGGSTNNANFIGCNFTGNTADVGGAVYSPSFGTNHAYFVGCTFTNNSAREGGAAYQGDGDKFSFTNCLFVGNQSTEKGGALYFAGATSTITNSTIYGNSTTSTSENSGAICAPNGLAIVNSILWGNTSAAGGAQQQIDYGSSTPNVTFSIVQGTPLISGTGNSNANPLFVNAADPNGADNIFATADDGLTLGSCSPGLNTGNNAVVTSTVDLTKATRIQNTTVDMGAYESANLPVFVTPSVSIVSNDTDNNIASGTSVTFTATPTNGGTSPTYQWKKNNVNVGSNSATYTDNTLVNGDKIKVEMTSSATCASPTAAMSNEITMAVCNTPTGFSVTGGGDACPGGTGVGIGLNGSQTGVNYQLRRGNTNVGNSVPGTGNALNFGNFSAQGTYTVVATTASGPCSATMNGSATVGTSSPASAGISANQSICSGATPANISLTGLVGSVVSWQRATNANFTGATDINTASSTLTGSSIGSLSTDTWFRAVIQNGTCPAINTSAVRITVQQSFTATAEANNSLICSNQTLRLTALPNQAGLSYNWRGPANFTNTLQNPTRTGLTTAMSGVYSVTITRSSCNNTSSATVSVMVSPSGAAFAPQMSQLRFNNTVPNAQTNTVGVCAGAAVTLQITANAHALTYNWRGPAGGSGSGFMSAPVSGVTNASASITAAVASNQQGQYTVTVRNGCNVINHKVINLQVLNCTSTRLASAEGDGSMGLSLEVAPNPVRDMVNVSVQGITGEVLQLNLVDAQGRSLQRVSVEASEGKAQHRFDLRSLPAGLYLLQAETATQRAVKKVIRL